MIDLGIFDLGPEFEQAVGHCAAAAVTAAITLLDQGAMLDELVAVLAHVEGRFSVTVGPASKLFADAPELAFLVALGRSKFPPGCLPWVASLGTRLAWGAFRVAPATVVAA
jgi:hypothetical protein